MEEENGSGLTAKAFLTLDGDLQPLNQLLNEKIRGYVKMNGLEIGKLPSSTSSFIQPCDCGVLFKSWKQHMGNSEILLGDDVISVFTKQVSKLNQPVNNLEAIYKYTWRTIMWRLSGLYNMIKSSFNTSGMRSSNMEVSADNVVKGFYNLSNHRTVIQHCEKYGQLWSGEFEDKGYLLDSEILAYFKRVSEPPSNKDLTSPSRFRSFVITNNKAYNYIVRGYGNMKVVENFMIDQSRVHGMQLPSVYQQDTSLPASLSEAPTSTTRSEISRINSQRIMRIIETIEKEPSDTSSPLC